MLLEQAVEQYGNAVLKYCSGILCDWHEAQDAMQETFIKAFRSAESLKTQEAYKAWLYKIAYRTCLNMLRGRKKHVALNESENFYEMENRFIDSELLSALQTLSPQDRAIFYSRAVEDLDYNRLEEIYNIRKPALRKRYERARAKLRAYLAEIGYIEEGSENL